MTFSALRPGWRRSHRPRLRPRQVGVALLLLLGGVLSCGKDGSKSPTSPSAANTQVQGISISGCQQAQGFQCVATATLSNGTTQTVSDQAQWSSSNSAVATISATGVLHPVTAGQTTISAAYSGKTGSANLTITDSQQPPAALTLDGSVFETAPTASTAIAGALVSILDGPNAGPPATSDGAGHFSFGNLQAGSFTVRATRQDYQQTDHAVTLTRSTTTTINMAPNPKVVDETFTGMISGGDAATCSDGIFTKPCKRISIPVHHSGNIVARLDWDGGSADLDLTLWRDGTSLIASSRGVNSTENISSAVQAGTSYQFRVTYYEGGNTVRYNLRVTHPN